MPFTTNAELKTAIADQLARSDLTSQIPDFISLFENEAARELFRMRPAELRTSLTPSSGTASLPSDYMGWRRVTWTGSKRVELDYVHPSILQAYYPSTPSGTPAVFTIEGSTVAATSVLKVRPSDDTALEVEYFAKLGALASALNWLMTNHSDCYFYGSLEQAYNYVKDYEQSGPWKLKKLEVYDSIKKHNFRERSDLVIRAMTTTP